MVFLGVCVCFVLLVFFGEFIALVWNCIRLGELYIAFCKENCGEEIQDYQWTSEGIFVFIKLVQCKILVPTTQALQCLMPNAVLAVNVPSIVRGEKWLARKSSVLCGICLVCVRRHSNGNKSGILFQLSSVWVGVLEKAHLLEPREFTATSLTAQECN